MMDLRALKTLETIAQLGSFQKAAEDLQYAQSTVTLQIQRLEADLGVPLFIREGKRVTLTEAGRWLSSEASGLFKSIDALRQTVSDIGIGESGSIHIAALEPAASQRIASIVADFCKHRPQIQLNMEVGGTRYIAESVLAGKLDFGISTAPPAHMQLPFEPLFEERLGVLLPAAHPLARKEAIAVEELDDLVVLLKEQSCAYRQLSEKTLLQLGHNPFSGIEVGSFQVIGQMVQAGLGVGIVPLYKGLEIQSSLAIRPFADVDPSVTIGMVYRDRNCMGKASLLLMNQIQNMLRKTSKNSDGHG